MPTKIDRSDVAAGNSSANGGPSNSIGQGLLVLLAATVLGVVMDIAGTFDAQKVAIYLIKGPAGDPISELTRIFVLLGTLNDFVVAPLVCLCVGTFVGYWARRWRHIIAVLAVVPVLTVRVMADFGHTRVLALAAVYLALTALTSHFASRLVKKGDNTGEKASEERRDKKPRSLARA